MNNIDNIAVKMSLEGSWIIQAGPGTGKTSLLVACIKNTLRSGNLRGRSIACITYSNVAANELRDRLPLEYIPQFIGTIHSFLLQHVIYPYAHVFPEIPDEFQIVTEGYARPWLNEMVRTGFLSNRKAHVPGIESGFERIGYNIVGEFVDFSHKGLTEREMAEFVRLRLVNGQVSQQDILWYSLKLLKNPEYGYVIDSLGCRFAKFLVDEFQDTTELQYAVLKELEAPGKTDLILVGDKHQSIFSFAGTHLDTFGSCVKRYPTQALPINYRSTQNIVRFSNLFVPGEMRVKCKSEYMNLNIPIFIIIGEFSGGDLIARFLKILEDYKLTSVIEEQDYLILARGISLVKRLAIAKKEILNGQQSNGAADALDQLRDTHPRLNVILRDVFAARGLICLNKNILAFECLNNALTNLILKANPGFGPTHLVGLTQDKWRLMITKCLYRLDLIEGSDIRDWVQNLRTLIHECILKCDGVQSRQKTVLLNNLKKVLPKRTEFPVETCVQSALAYIERTEVVRTVHSAKGVEAMAVMVVASDKRQFTTWFGPAASSANPSEESRIGFVAFTRPHKLLCIAVNKINVDVRAWLTGKEFIKIMDY